MMKNISLRQRLILAGLPAAMMCVAIAVEWSVICAFLKLPQMRVPYAVFFVTLVGLALVTYAARRPRSLWKCFIHGALIGQGAATVSLSLANLFIPNGIERNLRTLKQSGIAEMLLMDATVAFVLGGWLVAGGAFLAHQILARQQGMGERPG